MYSYLVMYQLVKEDGTECSGRCAVDRDIEIFDIEAISDIESYIKHGTMNVRRVVVTNIQRFPI